MTDKPGQPSRPVPSEDSERRTPAPAPRTLASYERRDVRSTVACVRGW